jgi:hypothetical protein
MRRLLLLGLSMGGLFFRAAAQDGFVGTATTLSYSVFDRDGKTFVNPSPDVAGSPFLKDEWRLGTLVLPDNRRYDSIRVRLNLLSEEVHILDKNNTEIALAKGYIKEVVWLEQVSRRPANNRFQNGFPAVDEQTMDNFYEVLSEGRLWLLHSIRKIISQHKDELSGEIKKVYQTYEDYYLYDGKTMQRVKKEKALIGGKEIKFKSIDQLKLAVDAYNVS